MKDTHTDRLFFLCIRFSLLLAFEYLLLSLAGFCNIEREEGGKRERGEERERTRERERKKERKRGW